MKKYFVLVALVLFTGLAFAGGPTPKAVSAFQKNFPQVTDVKWISVEEGHSASFVQDDIRYRVTYDANGNILNCLRYYKASALSFLIKAKVQRQYGEKEIFGVTEVTVDDETYYHILLQDAKNWLLVHADNYGNTFVEEKYKRSDAGNDLAKK